MVEREASEPPTELDPGGASAESPDPERAFERLAEDEALRGDLDDASFGPLLALSASLAVARAGRFATTGGLYGALRAFLDGAAEYARSGETIELAQGLGALLTDDEANLIWFSLASAGSPEARAADLARSVTRAVGLGDAA